MKIGADLVWQVQGETLGSVVEQTRQCQAMNAAATAAPLRLVHVVNLFLRDGMLPSDQLETIRAIGRARSASTLDVRVLVVVDPSDRAQLTTLVEPIVTNADVVATEFDGPMPQLQELLSCIADNTEDNEHVVFTNADICPVPGFHDGVASLLAAGAESIVINRRSTFGFWPGEPDAALAAYALGAAHPGFDCFVFAASSLTKMVSAHSTIGSPYVMLPLLLNLVAVSSPLLVLADAHLTYHFGDDRAWATDGRSEGADANLRAARAVRSSHAAAGTKRLQAFLTAFPNWDPTSILSD